jgi:hypothetical protein
MPDRGLDDGTLAAGGRRGADLHVPPGGLQRIRDLADTAPKRTLRDLMRAGPAAVGKAVPEILLAGGITLGIGPRPAAGVEVGIAERLFRTNCQKNSSRESSMVAGLLEQTDTPDLQDPELAKLRKGAQAPRLGDDLVRSCNDLGSRADRQARAPAGLQ